MKPSSSESGFERSFEDMGSKFKINETVYKPYASCRHTHGPINGTLELRARHGFSWEDVESVTVETYGTVVELAGNTDHSTPPAARSSIDYCLACALIFGRVKVDEFSTDVLKDPRIEKVIPRIKIEVTEKMNSMHPEKWSLMITIRTKDGNSKDIFIEYPKGDPENTMNDKEIENKYLALSSLKVPEKKAQALLQKCRAIEEEGSLRNFFREK